MGDEGVGQPSSVRRIGHDVRRKGVAFG
jgi:hypothetical protein